MASKLGTHSTAAAAESKWKIPSCSTSSMRQILTHLRLREQSGDVRVLMPRHVQLICTSFQKHHHSPHSCGHVPSPITSLLTLQIPPSIELGFKRLTDHILQGQTPFMFDICKLCNIKNCYEWVSNHLEFLNVVGRLHKDQRVLMTIVCEIFCHSEHQRNTVKNSIKTE